MTLPSTKSPSEGSAHSKNRDTNQIITEKCKQKQETKLVAPLIGKKCILPCRINGVSCETLLDTGAQVTIVGRDWLEHNLEGTVIEPIEKLLETNERLDLTAANGLGMPFEGWIEAVVEIQNVKYGRLAIEVPMLVSQSNLSLPLVGFNVVSEVIKGRDGINLQTFLKEVTVERTIVGNGVDSVEAIVDEPDNFSYMVNEQDDFSYMVKSGKIGFNIPSRQIRDVKCWVRGFPDGGLMLFEPGVISYLPEGLELYPSIVELPPGPSKAVKVKVFNTSAFDLWLAPKTCLGSIESIMAVNPIPLDDASVDIFENSPDPIPNVKGVGSQAALLTIQTEVSSSNNDNVNTVIREQWHPPVDLSHLTPKQAEAARQMLFEESDVFAKEDGDIGCVPTLNLKIKVCDDTPVQKSYNSIPKPLYKEVKDYIHTLLKRGWIQKSKSAYSSPIVCVRKKDQSLRLCNDFRGLNKKNHTRPPSSAEDSRPLRQPGGVYMVLYS